MAAKPKLIALNVVLALALGLIAWQGHARWVQAKAERRANLNVPIQRMTPPPVTPEQKPEAVQAAKYADVATKYLFSKDRSPAVVVEAPKVETPKVMPPLPVVFGVLTLPSGTRAIMAERSGAAGKSVRPGDSMGEFKILAMDASTVTFEWEGKQVERKVNDLVDHSGATTSAAAAAGPAAAAPGPAAPPTAAVLGADNGTAEAPTKACKPGESSPIGTVVDGYRKTGFMSPFGLVNCSWVLSK